MEKKLYILPIISIAISIIGTVIQIKADDPYFYCGYLKIKGTLNGTFSQCIEGYELLMKIGAK